MAWHPKDMSESRSPGGSASGRSDGPIARVGGLWRWWIKELSDTVTMPLGAGAGTGGLKRAAWDPETKSVEGARGRRLHGGPKGGRRRTGGRKPGAAGPFEIVLPAATILRKRLSLPIGALGDLDPVLRHELARHIPMPVEQAVWHSRIARRREDEGLVDLDLVLAPRSEIEAVRRACLDQGLRLAVISAPPERSIADGSSGPGGTRRAATIPLVREEASEASTARADTVLASLAGAALLIAGASPFLAYGTALQDIEQRARALSGASLAQGQSGVAAGAALVRSYAAYQERLGAPVPVTVLLEAVTTALPDTAWVSGFALEDRTLVLEGVAESAGDLVPLLEALPMVERVAFAAPTVVDQRLSLERFRIAVALKAPTRSEEGAARP